MANITAATRQNRSIIGITPEDDFANDQAQLARAGIYELLAGLLAREPGAELLQSLASMDPVNTSEGQVAVGWEQLRVASVEVTSVEVTSPDVGKSAVDVVADEYFNLFLGVGRGELVPFGSWYLTGFLMEKPLSQLRTDLAAFGIERQEGIKESEDHIASLCDAMAIAINSADEIPNDRQQQFFSDHLEPWVSRFFADLQSARSARFYRAVGYFGERFFDVEKQLFLMQT